MYCICSRLGRPPTELAASISGANGIATGKNEEMVPIGRRAHQAIERGTETTRSSHTSRDSRDCFWASSREGPPFEVCDFLSHSLPIINTLFRTRSAVNSGDILHGPSPAATTHTAPQATNRQSIRVNISGQNIATGAT